MCTAEKLELHVGIGSNQSEDKVVDSKTSSTIQTITFCLISCKKYDPLTLFDAKDSPRIEFPFFDIEPVVVCVTMLTRQTSYL